jgi:shikimate kinase
MIILLIGTVASGKTTVAQILSKKINLPYIEMDDYILNHLSIKEPSEISQSFLKEGQLEISKDLSTQDNLILCCSGNIVENDLNLIYFKENNENLKIFFLETTPKEAVKRLENKIKKRQISAEKLESMIKKRISLYSDWADYTINTDNKTPKQILSEILELI